MPSKSLLTQIMYEFGYGNHSIFSASGSATWINCPGSLIANLFEEDETSFECAEGSVAHGIAETWLKTGIRPDHRIGEVVHYVENGSEHDILITRAMLDYLEEYVDWCFHLDGEMYTEIRVWYTDLMPPANPDGLEDGEDDEVEPFVRQGGTADNIIIQPDERRIVVTDLKYGTGVQVFAKENSQALLYAYGTYKAFCDEYDIDTVLIRICQPRLSHFDEWEVPVEYLKTFADHVRVAAAEAWSLKAPRRATLKGCRWCKSSHNCAAIAYMMECAVGADMDMLEGRFGEYEMSILRQTLAEKYKFRRADFGNLSTEDMAKILPYRKVVENWFARMDLELERRALDGAAVPNFKLVESRSNRVYTDQRRAMELFDFLDIPRDKYIESKLRSPAQMEEVLREELGVSRSGAPELIENIVFKPSGKPTLAPLTDKRPELSSRGVEFFDDDDDDDDDDV